ncbi:O-methyltransferase, partial [Toxoplasma gondii FOU]
RSFLSAFLGPLWVPWSSGKAKHPQGNLASFSSHPSSRLRHPPSSDGSRRLRVFTSPLLSLSPLSSPRSSSPYSFLTVSPSSPSPLSASSRASISSFSGSPLPPPQALSRASAVDSLESPSASPPSLRASAPCAEAANGAGLRAAGGRGPEAELGGQSKTCAQSGRNLRERERRELEARGDARVAGESNLSGREAECQERGDEESANVGVDALGELHAEATAASSASVAQETILDQLRLATEELVWGRESGEKTNSDKARAEACRRRSLRGKDAERSPRLEIEEASRMWRGRSDEQPTRAESEEESAPAREVARGRGTRLSKKTRGEGEREDANPREVSETSSGPWWSDKLQCRLLSTISRLQKPRAILEIGTFTGLSTLSLAEGLSINARPSHPSPAEWWKSPRSEQQSGNEEKEEEEETQETPARRPGAKDHLLPQSENGHNLEGRPPVLVTIERDRRALDVARSHFASSPYAAYIRVIEGEAREALALLQRKVKPRSVEGGGGPRLVESKRERKTLDEEQDEASEKESQARGERGERTNGKGEDERVRGEGDRQASLSSLHFPETHQDARQADDTKAEHGQASFAVESDLRNLLIPPEGFDLIFLDASKRQYGEFLRKFILHPSQPLLAPGGLLLIDNILFKANRKRDASSGALVAREKELDFGDATAETRKEGDSGDEAETPTHDQRNADGRREQANGRNEELSDPEHTNEIRHTEQLEERVIEENKTPEVEENGKRREREKKKEKRERRLEEIEREMKLVREMLRSDERVAQLVLPIRDGLSVVAWR